MSKGARAIVVAAAFPEGEQGRGKNEGARKAQKIGGFNREMLRMARLVLRVTPTIAASVRDDQKPLSVAYEEAKAIEAERAEFNRKLDRLKASAPDLFELRRRVTSANVACQSRLIGKMPQNGFEPMFDISLRTANSLHFVFNTLTILGALFALIGTAGSIWTGEVRDRFSEMEKRQLEAKIAPRRLSEAQKEALAARLAKSGWKKAEIIWHGDGEPEKYARDFAGVFERSKIETRVHTFGSFIPSAWGLLVVVTENDDSARLKAMLDESGIFASLATTNETLGKKDHPTLFVGSRED